MKTIAEDPHVLIRLSDEQIDALTGRELDKAVANYAGYKVEPYPERSLSGDFRIYFVNKNEQWWDGGTLPEYHKNAVFALGMVPEIFELGNAVVQLQYGFGAQNENGPASWGCTVRRAGVMRIGSISKSDGDSEGHVDPDLPVADNNLQSFCSAIWRTWMKLKNNEAEDTEAVQSPAGATDANSGQKTGNSV